MCAHVEISDIDEARDRRIRELLDRFSDVRSGNIGEPQKHVEFEPMPEASPVQEPAAPAVAPEPVSVPA
jgi:hypothetical protein